MNIYIIKLIVKPIETMVKGKDNYQTIFTCTKSTNEWTYDEKQGIYIREDLRAGYSATIVTYEVDDSQIVSSMAMSEEPTEEQLKAIEIAMRGSMKNFLDYLYSKQKRTYESHMQSLITTPNVEHPTVEKLD